jgi:hypothetical protein
MYGGLSDIVSSSDDIVLNGRVIGELVRRDEGSTSDLIRGAVPAFACRN